MDFLTTIPNAPLNVVVSDTNYDNVTLSWNFPSYNGGAEIIEYIITSDPPTNPINELIVNSCTSTTIYSGLTSGETYRFNVKSHNSVGFSEIAQSNYVTLPIPPT